MPKHARITEGLVGFDFFVSFSGLLDVLCKEASTLNLASGRAATDYACLRLYSQPSGST